MNISKDRFNFSFNHGARVVKMHCHEDEYAAKVAFQQRFGYWPEDAVWVERYVSES